MSKHTLRTKRTKSPSGLTSRARARKAANARWGNTALALEGLLRAGKKRSSSVIEFPAATVPAKSTSGKATTATTLQFSPATSIHTQATPQTQITPFKAILPFSQAKTIPMAAGAETQRIAPPREVVATGRGTVIQWARARDERTQDVVGWWAD